jgi:hypothetical protein
VSLLIKKNYINILKLNIKNLENYFFKKKKRKKRGGLLATPATLSFFTFFFLVREKEFLKFLIFKCFFFF